MNLSRIEGDPDSPISRGRLCPKGAASKQLVTSPCRVTRVRYRRPYGTQWEDLPLLVAMEMIADRVIGTREQTWQERDQHGRRVNRTLGYLSELQPEMFCEVSPELAELRGLVNGGWATIVTSRAAVEARVLVTGRMRPLLVDGRVVHQVGLPYHFGRNGLATGDSANDLFGIVLDPNVHLQESKAANCDTRPKASWARPGRAGRVLQGPVRHRGCGA